jgi:uncharacterized protein (DUF885 family)
VKIGAIRGLLWMMNRTSVKFEGLLDRYFEAVLADNPVYATYTGLKMGEGKLGHSNLAFETRQEKRRRRALAILDGLSPGDLSNDQQLDRLALRSRLVHESEDFEHGRHTLDPNALDQILNILLHELFRVEDEPKRAARNIRSLLAETPRYLAEAATLIDRPERIWLKIMEQTAQGAPALFDAVATLLQRVEPVPADARRIDTARKSFQIYEQAVAACPMAPDGAFAVGSTVLQRRVRDEVGLDYTLGEIESLAKMEIERLRGLLNMACRKFGKNRRPEQIIDDARSQWNPAGELIELYRSQTKDIANAFREAKAVSFPKGEKLEVRPVPDFLRHLIPTAAYNSPGAFEKVQRGIFWVNDLSLAKATEAEKRAERGQHFEISLTCAHEAYPGHHLQFVTANRHPRRWRRLFAHAVFYEGWTLWCEQMMVDLKVDRSPWLVVQQLHGALWRAHRILIDLYLQTKRYSYGQAVRHLQKHLGFTKARAEADVNWYTARPAVPMSYWLGRLENERLRRRLMEGRNWTLKRFNDWLLSFGTLPQSWLEKYGLD